MSKYYIDCEFDGHGGPIISMALVRSRADSLLIVAHPRAEPRDRWVRENVMSVLHSDQAETTCWRDPHMFGSAIREFIGSDPQPHIIADSPVDIARFCQAVSTGDEGGWASTDYERMTFTVENVDCYPTDLPGAVQHNAWWDAMALRHKLTSLGSLTNPYTE